jgi:hypothetical protein
MKATVLSIAAHIVIGLIALAGVYFLVTTETPGDRRAHEREVRRLWCAQMCGANRVLVCTHVEDSPWPDERKVTVCLLDANGSETRSVVEPKDGGL